METMILVWKSMETRDLYGDVWISMILYGFVWMVMGLYRY